MKQDKLIDTILNEFKKDGVTAYRDTVANKLAEKAGVDVSTAYQVIDGHEVRRFDEAAKGIR